MKKLADPYENPLVTRSKKMLTDAFFELLKEEPGQKIKISTLCEKAGVARPTFYSHYQTIEDIPRAYFDIWLNDVKIWVHQKSQEKPPLLLDSENPNSFQFWVLVFQYWCSEVELAKSLQKAGYENIIQQCFIEAVDLVMIEMIGPSFDLSIYFQNFLTSKAALVTHELYKYWIATGRQLSVEQLAEITFHLNTKQEIIEIRRISMGKT